MIVLMRLVTIIMSIMSRRRGKGRRRLREAVISDETEVEETGTEKVETGERGPGDEVASHIQVTKFLIFRPVDVKLDV